MYDNREYPRFRLSDHLCLSALVCLGFLDVRRPISMVQAHTVLSCYHTCARHQLNLTVDYYYNLIYNRTNMRVQRTRTTQLRALLTTTLGHPKSTQCNFNSCLFNYKSAYSENPLCGSFRVDHEYSLYSSIVVLKEYYSFIMK